MFTARPFLKWAGGKGQLLQQLESALPPILRDSKFTYIEPFVGGGAMLFFMLQQYPNIEKVVINDINTNLAQAYKDIKNRPAELVKILKAIERNYFALDSEEQRKGYYLDIRKQFNDKTCERGVERTAMLLFLNRTCFNGLYRENAKGEFNVPFGRYVNPTICNEEIIYADSELLNQFNVTILTGDYKRTFNKVTTSQIHFFYFDPPYRPISQTSSFNTYVKESFNDHSQRELAQFCRQIDLLPNCLWMLSNSDCSAANPEDRFFEEIYNGFNIQRVVAKRAINANPSKRGKLTELLIKNYEDDFPTRKVSEDLINYE